MTDVEVTPAERRLILWALAVVLLLSALDQTIVSTAMPRIIEDLQGMSMYAWVTTSYLLTSTVAVPIYGKLSDLYGRKPILIVGIVLFLAGSALCGLSGEFGDVPVLGGGMMQLVIFRAIQGLGGGALMSMTFAIIADLYPPRERGKLFGVFGSVFGLATIIGPFIGGFFTDHGTVTLLNHVVAGWRWVFYINLPLGGLAMFMVLYRMPSLKHGGGGRVDYVGAALIVMTVTPLLLALTLGGTSYPWDSPHIVGLFVAAAVSLAIFLWVESRTQDAIVPLHLFKLRTFSIATLAAFVVSMAFLGVVLFMPLYMQVVQGISATQSGVAMLPMMAGMIVSSTLSGRLVSRTGRYKPFMIGGGLVLIVGVILLTQIGPHTTSGDLAWRLAITGIGLGPTQNLFSLVIQNAVPMTELGVASSMSQFSRQIGATVGVAIFGTFLSHSLHDELPRHLPLMPGTAMHDVDLSQAQSQAMDEARIRASVDRALQERYLVIERAYTGDSAAVDEVLGDPQLPESLKGALRDGGIRARVHERLESQADHVAARLLDGKAGRDALLADDDLPASLKTHLANLPERALGSADAMQGVIPLFRASILAQEDAQVDAAIRQALATVRTAVAAYSTTLVAQIRDGTKEAFSLSITDMFSRALWIVVLGVLIMAFIPELPLRSRHSPVPAE
ncbi:MDR family MFS transporter [Povalibacter sp.]|uniref:MDR family MFS transporter n=1 Tax=Povalibacter sp. TaxID=1962978 RepID=UPI002F417489